MTSPKTLGELVEVVVGHDGTSAGSSWHLQLLVVTEVVTKKTWRCKCGMWMDAAAGDRQTVRRLKASAANPLTQKVNYEVQRAACWGGLIWAAYVQCRERQFTFWSLPD